MELDRPRWFTFAAASPLVIDSPLRAADGC